MMASGADALNFIRNNFETEQAGEGLKLLWSWDDGRTQMVFAFGVNDLLVVTSPFADKSLTPSLALTVADDQPFGIKVFGDFYAVVHVVPTTDLDKSEIQFAINAVAGAADTLEEKVGGDKF